MVCRETFLQIHRRLLRHLNQGEFNPWISKVTEDTCTARPVTCGERQIPDTILNPRFQPGSSARNSFDPKEGRFSKDYGADQQRLQVVNLETIIQWIQSVQNKNFTRNPEKLAKVPGTREETKSHLH